MNVLLIGGARGLGAAIYSAIDQTDHVIALPRAQVDLNSSYDHIVGQVRDAIRRKGRYWPVDALIVSSGQGAFMGPTVSGAKAEELFRVNTLGPIACYQGALPGLIKGKGKVILITSTVARKPGSGALSLYAATKGALHSWVISEARRAAKKGIGICAVAPGYMETPMTAEMAPDLKAATLRNIPFDRYGTPEEVALFVKDLLRQSNWCISGSIFEVSGGA